MSSSVRWGTIIGVAVLVLLGCAPGAQARLRWYRCHDVHADCAMLRVPLDRSGHLAGDVRLRAARFSSPAHGRPVLLYLSGGPGGAGVREFSDVLFEVGALARRFQLVSFDQRGTGYSGLLRCPDLELDPRLRETRAAGACAKRLGKRRGLYRTQDSVEDMEALRKALGASKLTLFGISYGTKLALAYARAHPDRVDRMVLDSVLDPDDADAFGLEPYRAMSRTLAALCPEHCRGMSSDPAGDLARLVALLERSPLRARVATQRGSRVGTLTALALSDLMFDADYNPPLRAGIPAAVRAALEHRDAAPLLRLVAAAGRLSALPGAREFSAARYAAVCDETPLPWPSGTPFEQREGYARARAGELGRQAFYPFDYATARADEIDLCLRWPEAGAPAASDTAYPAVPTLILQGAEDLRTPPESSARVAAKLAQVQRVVVPGVGHAVVGGDPSRCGVRRIYAFLRGRRASAPCRRVATGVAAIAVAPDSLSRLAPARGTRGRAGRTVAAVDATLDDLTFSLSPAFGSRSSGAGLRGGRFRLRGSTITVAGLEFVPGVRVSGRIGRGGARLGVSGRAAARGRLRISADGRVRGRLAGRAVRAQLGAGPPRPVSSRAARRPAAVAAAARVR